MLAVSFASAQNGLTPAGTQIRTQASALFVDSANVPRETVSNVVLTVVQKVTGVAMTPASVQRSTGPGGEGLFPFTITNTGNAADAVQVSSSDSDSGSGTTFTPLYHTLVHDENCNGRIDPGEPTSPAASGLVLDIDALANACILVALGVPVGAEAAATRDFSVSARVSVGSTTISTTDAEVVRTGTLSVVGSGFIGAVLAAEPQSLLAPGGAVVWTVSGSNTSGLAVSGSDAIGILPPGIFVELPIPAGISLSDVVMVTGAGSAVRYTKVNGEDWATPGALASATDVGMLITGSGAFFPSGAQFSLEVQGVEADPTRNSGTLYATEATVFFNSSETFSTNTVTLAKGFAAGVSFTDSSYSSSDNLSGSDTTIAALNSGTILTLRNTLRNDGNSSDRFNLTVSSSDSSWICRLFEGDGATPLSGPIGPIARDQTREVITRCNLPIAAKASPTTVSVNAASVADPSVSASVAWTVSSLDLGFSVSISDAVAAVTSASTSVVDGERVSFMVAVENRGASPDTFALSLPTGTIADRVDFYRSGAVAANGTACSTVSAEGLATLRAGTRATTTGLLPRGQRICMVVDVRIAAGARSGSGSASLTARSTTAGADAEVNRALDFTVLHRAGFLFLPERSAVITSPGTVTLSHTLRNSGNTTGTLTLPAAAASPEGSGRVLFSTDNVTFSESLAGVTLTAGAELTLQVRLVAPAGQPPGRRISVSVSPTLTYGSAGALTRSVTNTYEIIDGVLRLDLSVENCGGDATCTSTLLAGESAKPTDVLRYTLLATNLGATSISQVVLSEPLPPFTDFVSLSAANSFAGTLEYSVDGVTFSQTAPLSPAVVAGGSVYVRVRSGPGGGDLPIPPGGTITLTLIVQVR